MAFHKFLLKEGLAKEEPKRREGENIHKIRKRAFDVSRDIDWFEKE